MRSWREVRKNEESIPNKLEKNFDFISFFRTDELPGLYILGILRAWTIATSWVEVLNA